MGTVLVIRGTIGGFLGRAPSTVTGLLLLVRVGGARSSSSEEPSRRLTEARGASRLLCMSIMLGIAYVDGLVLAVDSSRLEPRARAKDTRSLVELAGMGPLKGPLSLPMSEASSKLALRRMGPTIGLAMGFLLSNP